MDPSIRDFHRTHVEKKISILSNPVIIYKTHVKVEI